MKDTHPFTGTVIIPVAQLVEIIEVKVEAGIKKELDRREQEGSTAAMPDLLTAEEAAELLRYKSKSPLRQYHGTELKPIRRGRRLFYKSSEVTQLKKRLFNL